MKSDNQEQCLAFINSINDNIQFTSEFEQNGKLPFLDMEIIRQEQGNVKFSIYRKPTFSGTLLNFHSYNHL